MLRRFAISSLLLVTGFSAGLVLTGRMRSASESHAETQCAGRAAAPHRPAAAASRAVSAGLHAHWQRRQGGREHLALQVVRTPARPFGSDPFFRYFFGDGDEASGPATGGR
jgi:hypothetical protein